MKLTKDESEQLKAATDRKTAIVHDLGILATQSHQLQHFFATVNQEINDAKVKLEKKYGKIEINLETGEYKKIKDE